MEDRTANYISKFFFVGEHRTVKSSKTDFVHLGIRQSQLCRVLPTILGPLTATDWTVRKSKFQHLKNVDIKPPFKNGKIDLLIGGDYGALHAEVEASVVGRGAHDPIARHYRLGWSISGPINKLSAEKCMAIYKDLQDCKDQAINSALASLPKAEKASLFRGTGLKQIS